MLQWQKKMINNLFPISKTGIKYICCAFFFFVVFEILDVDFLANLSFVSILVFLYLFRNPEREIPTFAEASLVSPVDGVIRAIDEIDDKEYAYKIEIETSYKDVALLRAPMNAKVETLALSKGTRVSKHHALFEKTNENVSIEFRDSLDNKIKLVHRLKQSFHPLSLDIILNQELRQSTRYGVALNAITTMYIPKNFRLNASVNNELIASQTLLGYFS